VLCLPAAACREACDLLPGCAGVRILAAHMCELLGSLSSNATFRDQDGSVYERHAGRACTLNEDFARPVGQLTVHGVVPTQVRYVVPPYECSSVEVPAPLGETFDPAADALRIIDAYGECGESPASEHIELCPEELQEEDYFALCAEECEEVDNTQPTPVPTPACSDRDPLPEFLLSRGIDPDYFASQGGCPGAVRGIVDEDGHTCMEDLHAMGQTALHWGNATPGTTLCGLCCASCAADGQVCPEELLLYPRVVEAPSETDLSAGAACFSTCRERITTGQVEVPSFMARRRRTPTPQVMRIAPLRAVAGGRFKLCFCDAEAAGGECSAAADFKFQVGEIYSSGVSCLLESGLRDQACMPQAEGGLRCEPA